MFLVTGASGFIGRELCRELTRRGHAVRAAVRANAARVEAPADLVEIGDISGHVDWDAALEGIDCVVHLAARVHVMRDTAADPLGAFRAVNVEATRALAEAAVRRGVRRFVFVSSIKVNGEITHDRPFRPDDPPAPQDAYGRSKLEAESALAEVSARHGLEVVVVRPPLVYGSGVGGNFLRLMRLIDAGMPLPLRGIDNCRSLVCSRNLVDALIACTSHHNAAGETFLVSDGEDLSTAELVKRLAHALGRPARLICVPRMLLESAGRLTGRSAEIERLISSLRVETDRIRSQLAWTPPFSVEEALAETARSYRLARAPFAGGL